MIQSRVGEIRVLFLDFESFRPEEIRLLVPHKKMKKIRFSLET